MRGVRQAAWNRAGWRQDRWNDWRDRREDWWHDRRDRRRNFYFSNYYYGGVPYYYPSNYYYSSYYPSDYYSDYSDYYAPTATVYATTTPRYTYAVAGSSTVVTVQRELARLGYYRGAIDGIMGPMTRSAILRYEADNGLPRYSSITRSLLLSLGVA